MQVECGQRDGDCPTRTDDLRCMLARRGERMRWLGTPLTLQSLNPTWCWCLRTEHLVNPLHPWTGTAASSERGIRRVGD